MQVQKDKFKMSSPKAHSTFESCEDLEKFVKNYSNRIYGGNLFLIKKSTAPDPRNNELRYTSLRYICARSGKSIFGNSQKCDCDYKFIVERNNNKTKLEIKNNSKSNKFHSNFVHNEMCISETKKLLNDTRGT